MMSRCNCVTKKIELHSNSLHVAAQRSGEYALRQALKLKNDAAPFVDDYLLYLPVVCPDRPSLASRGNCKRDVFPDQPLQQTDRGSRKIISVNYSTAQTT